MGSLELILPSYLLQDSYESYLGEVVALGERFIPFVLGLPYENFQDLIAKLDEASRGVGLEDGWAPHSTFWLVENSSELIGVVNIRHYLTDSLLDRGGHIGYGIRPSRRKEGFGKVALGLGLQKAKELGVKKALLTCWNDNLASKKIIESNGGVLEKTSISEADKKLTNYYWIGIE